MDVQERQYLTPELQEQSIAPKLQTHMVYQMDQTNDSNESGDDTGYTGHEIRYELIGKHPIPDPHCKCPACFCGVPFVR